MRDNFKYQCKRRSARQHPLREESIVEGQELLGAGSGGDGGDGNVTSYTDGVYSVATPQTIVHACGALGEGEAPGIIPMIALLAGDVLSSQGLIYARGTRGVRITSGPPHQPQMRNEEINGVEIQTGETQEIIMMRGSPAEQVVQISPGLMVVNSPSLISIRSDSQIELSVAGGTSSIILSPSGIVLKGPIIQIN